MTVFVTDRFPASARTQRCTAILSAKWLTMNTSLLPTALISTLLLTACASPEYKWRKDGAGANDFDADFAVCTQIAAKIPHASDVQLGDNTFQCMVQRSWYQKRVN